MAKIDLKKIPKPVRIVIAIVPSLLFIILFCYFAILPKNKQIKTLKEEIATQENEIRKSQSMADRLDELKAENEKLKARLEELARQLPEEKEISVLLSQVSNLSIQSGLNILSWRPSSKRDHPSKIVYEVPVSVDLVGSYHSLGEFFSALTRLDRIVNITDIRLAGPRPKGDKTELNISFSALTFIAATEGGLVAK